MKKLLVLASWAGFLALLLVLKLGVQVPAAHAASVTGYFTGATINAGDGELANPKGSCGSHAANAPGYEDGKCSDLSGVATVSGTTNQMNLLLFDLGEDVNGANGNKQAAGAAFIIEVGLYGTNKPANINSVNAGILDAQNNFTKFANLVKQYNAAGQLTFMSFQNGKNSAKDDSSLDSGFYFPPGDPVYTAVFCNDICTGNGSNAIFSVRLNCGNIDGNLGGIPPLPISATLTIKDLDNGTNSSVFNNSATLKTAPLSVSQDDNLTFTWSSSNTTACAKRLDWPIDDGSNSDGSGVQIGTSGGPSDRLNRDTNTLTTKAINLNCTDGIGDSVPIQINVIVSAQGNPYDQITLTDVTAGNTSVTAKATRANTPVTQTFQATVGDVLKVTSSKSANINDSGSSCGAVGATPWNNNANVVKNSTFPTSSANYVTLNSSYTATANSTSVGVEILCNDSGNIQAAVRFTVVSPAYHPYLQIQRGDVFSCSSSCTSGQNSQDQPLNVPAGNSLGAPTSNYQAELIVSSAIGTNNFCSTRGYNFGYQGTSNATACTSGPYVPSFNQFSFFLTNAAKVAAQSSGCSAQPPLYKNGTLLGGTSGNNIAANTLTINANTDVQKLAGLSLTCSASGAFYTYNPRIGQTGGQSGPNFVLASSSGTISHGAATIYVANGGNVYITGNITNAYSGTYANPGDIPSLAIITTGDIDIDPSVTNIDLSLFAGGTIRTCKDTSSTNTQYGTSACNKALTIRGLVVANAFELGRNYFLASSPTPAEDLIVPAADLAFPPPGFADISSTTATQAQTLFQENNGRF